MGAACHAFIKSIIDVLLKSQIQNYDPTSIRKRMGGCEVFSTTLHKLPQNKVLYIEEGGLNNFAQVTIVL